MPAVGEDGHQEGVEVQPLHQEPVEVGHDAVLEEDQAQLAAHLDATDRVRESTLRLDEDFRGRQPAPGPNASPCCTRHVDTQHRGAAWRCVPVQVRPWNSLEGSLGPRQKHTVSLRVTCNFESDHVGPGTLG